MTKNEIIKKLSDETRVTQKDVRAVLDALTNPKPGKGLIATRLNKGKKVILAGFGTFCVRERKARKARNPRTGGTVKVPKRRYPAFRFSKTLKDALK